MVEFEQFEQVTATKCGQRKSRVSRSTSIFRYGYLVNYHALLFMYIFGDFHNLHSRRRHFVGRAVGAKEGVSYHLNACFFRRQVVEK